MNVIPPGMRVAFHANTLVADIHDPRFAAMLPRLVQLGYTALALPPLEPDTPTQPVVDMLRDSELHPIPMASLTPQANVASPDRAVRAAGLHRLRAFVDFAVALGSDQLNGVPYGLFGTPSEPVSESALREAARAVGEVAEEAHDRGVTMTFEVLNRYETSAINTAEQALQFVDDSASPHLRIHLDTFHMGIEEADMAAAIDLAMPKLGYLELGQSGRGRLSRGALDLAGVAAHAHRAGYRGRWGVEAFTRHVLGPDIANTLAIWRRTYDDGIDVAEDAVAVFQAAHSGAPLAGAHAARRDADVEPNHRFTSDRF